MNKKYIVGIGTNGCTEKPQSQKIAGIKKDTVSNYREYSFDEISDLVGNKGHAIMPAYLRGGMKQENFRSIQLFMLDFDGTEGKQISLHDVLKRADEYSVPVAFAYKTLSAPNADHCLKFRVAFIHEFSLSDRNLALLVYRELIRIFPEADSACAELSRLFLGGKGLLYSNSAARFNLVNTTLSIYPALNDRSGHFRRNLRSMMKGIDIAIIDDRIAVGTERMLSIFGENLDPANIITIAETGFPPIFYCKASDDKNFHQGRTRTIHKHKLDVHDKGRCALLDDFFAGVHLDHNRRFLIATNLANIQGGKSEFQNVMEEYYTEGTRKKWEVDFKWIERYQPMSCSAEVCPYYRECHKTSAEPNIVSRILNDRRILVEDAEEYISLDEAHLQLKECIEKVINSTETGFHIIKAQTALGKTSAIIEAVQKYDKKRFLIAEPTCAMKEQLQNDLLPYCSDEIFVTESVRNNPYIQESDRERFQSLHDSGNHHEASRYIQGIYDECCTKEPYAKAKLEFLKILVDGIRGGKDSRITVTTHAMLLNMKGAVLNEYDVVMVDEDILYLQILCNSKTISRDTLMKVRDSGVYGFSHIAGEMLKAKPEKYYKLQPNYRALPEWQECIKPTMEDYDDIPVCVTGDNVTDLRQAVSYIMHEDGEYKYFCVPSMEGSKYIVLSATANGKIYRDFFERHGFIVKEYDIPRVKYTGTLKQFTYHSLGRRDLRNREEKLGAFLSELEAEVNEEVYRISFLAEEKKNPKMNPYGIHFGNATGKNGLKGQNLIIYGTPFKHPDAYLLPCCFMYGEPVVNADRMCNRRVLYKGRSFLIMAFSDERLRLFEMYSLESELEQAIGRARLLRFDATVYLLSCFPCDQAEIFTADYLRKYEQEEGAA